MTKQLPLIVILGATACGKSKLAIELARRFNGEIISADSMQVYRGLDIVTNKVSTEEQALAKHHMISFLDPGQRYSVVDFRDKSLDIIQDLYKNHSLPIVVGGTNYYIESLIWRGLLLKPAQPDGKLNKDVEDVAGQTLIDSEAEVLAKHSKDSLHSEDDFLNADRFFKKPIYNDGFPHVDGEKLWRILEEVDPRSAHFYHPNDRRRIIRSLQIIQQKRKNFSALLDEVNKSVQEGQHSLGGPLRFDPTCVFWLSCEAQLLQEVLDQRVDQMIERGLIDELEQFHHNHNEERVRLNEKPDYEKGIFQTIGFKEFHDYLILSREEKNSPSGKKTLEKSIENMKLSTRRYSKKQVKWIRSRFIQSGNRDLPQLFKLTTTLDEGLWEQQVLEPAASIVESLIKQIPLSDHLKSFRQEPEKQFSPNEPKKLYCEACDRTFIGSNNVDSHLKSKRHMKNVSDSDCKKHKLTQ